MSEETPNTEATPDAPVQETPQAETFGLDYVQSLRQEAAKYRNEKKTAVEEAKAELTRQWESKLAARDTEFTEIQNSLSAREVQLAKLQATLDLNVPSDKVLAFADIIKGSTEDEIKESAKSTYELFGGFKTTGPAVDPTQGSGGGVIPLNGDPILEALKRAVRKN